MKICSKCSNKYYSKGLCKKHYMDQWRTNNGDHVKEYNITNKENHRLACRLYVREKRKDPEFREESNTKARKRYNNDPEFRKKNIVKVRKWQENNPERHKENKRKWYKNNPTSSKCRYGDDIDLLLAMNSVRIRDNNSCVWYNCDKNYKTSTIHVHHIFPQNEYPQYRYIEMYMICYCKYHHSQWHKARKDPYWQLIF